MPCVTSNQADLVARGDAITDEELVARACGGDPQAFGRLALRHRRRLRGLLARLLGPDELDDREQEVFIAAWRALRRFRGEASFRTWLTRIAVNHATRCLRRRKFRPESLAEEPEGRAAGPEACLAAAETRERVGRAIGSLSPRLRVTFMLRYVEEMSGEEVARVLGVPAATNDWSSWR